MCASALADFHAGVAQWRVFTCQVRGPGSTPAPAPGRLAQMEARFHGYERGRRFKSCTAHGACSSVEKNRFCMLCDSRALAKGARGHGFDSRQVLGYVQSTARVQRPDARQTARLQTLDAGCHADKPQGYSAHLASARSDPVSVLAWGQNPPVSRSLLSDQ